MGLRCRLSGTDLSAWAWVLGFWGASFFKCLVVVTQQEPEACTECSGSSRCIDLFEPRIAGF